MPSPNTIKFSMRQNDRLPVIRFHLVQADDQPFDLTPFVSAAFKLAPEGSTTLKVDGVVTLLTPLADGRLEYQWQAGDTDTEGLFIGELILTNINGQTLSIRVEVQVDGSLH